MKNYFQQGLTVLSCLLTIGCNTKDPNILKLYDYKPINLDTTTEIIQAVEIDDEDLYSFYFAFSQKETKEVNEENDKIWSYVLNLAPNPIGKTQTKKNYFTANLMITDLDNKIIFNQQGIEVYKEGRFSKHNKMYCDMNLGHVKLKSGNYIFKVSNININPQLKPFINSYSIHRTRQGK